MTPITPGRAETWHAANQRLIAHVRACRQCRRRGTYISYCDEAIQLRDYAHAVWHSWPDPPKGEGYEHSKALE